MTVDQTRFENTATLVQERRKRFIEEGVSELEKELRAARSNGGGEGRKDREKEILDFKT